MLFNLTIEAKEDETYEGVQPREPAPDEAAVRLQDVLQDVTKHDGMIGWRVTTVNPGGDGTALVSADDLRAVLDRVRDGRWLDYRPEGEAARRLREQIEGVR